MKLKFNSFLAKFLFSFSLFLITSSNLNLKPAFAEFDNLILCKNSVQFQKKLNSEVKKLENRLKLYTPESKEAKFLIREIEHTKNRFEKYGNSNLLCGKEGLPRIIANGDWKYSNQFVIPGILFLYITGWIGWVGRKYLHFANKTENSFENEIIINVPVALSIMTSGFLWPIEIWKEFTAGDLLESDDNITISPR
jgi:photosystem I subunit 3